MKLKSTFQENTTTCPICSWSPEDLDYLFLHETKYWRIVLAPNQGLVGRSVVSLKRHCGDLAELTPEEVLDWLSVVRLFEKALQIAFNATMFNWSCYMNHAYRENSPDPHIHWWAVPRYNHQVHIANSVFEDTEFGNPYDHHNIEIVPRELHNQIAEQIKLAITQIISNRIKT